MREGYNVIILCRTGSNESVSVCAAALSVLFNEQNELDESIGKKIDKELICRRFTFMQSYCNNAAPTRNMIKVINRFLTYKSRR